MFDDAAELLRRQSTQFVIGRNGETAPRRAAVFGGTNQEYRYVLERTWDPCGRRVLFVLLNPSTATEEADDATQRRCRAFARAWGFGGYDVCNLFALRSTHPRALYTHADPVGPRNDEAIRWAHRRSALTVAAWGRHGALRSRGSAVAELLAAERSAWALVVNADGSPRHPLYVRGDVRPAAWPVPGGGSVSP